VKLLAFDTSTATCSVALMLGDRIHEREVRGMRHAETILPSVQALLREADVKLRDLDVIAFGRGPGSFTSLRIGASVVQGLAFGAGVPVVPVSSLAALAQSCGAQRVHAAIDARMGQVYAATFERGKDDLVIANGPECVCTPDEAPLPDGMGWTGSGSGWDQYADALSARLGARLEKWLPGQFPRASAVGALATARYLAGEALPPEQALPVYVRDDVARKRAD